MPVKIDSDATASHKTLLLFTLLLFSGKRHYLSDLLEGHGHAPDADH
jgi:hypothetical protein